MLYLLSPKPTKSQITRKDSKYKESLEVREPRHSVFRPFVIVHFLIPLFTTSVTSSEESG